MKIIDECNHSEFSALDSKSLNVPFYYQGNSLWANDIMQTCGKTIGSEGCTITCLAMIQKYFTSLALEIRVLLIKRLEMGLVRWRAILLLQQHAV